MLGSLSYDPGSGLAGILVAVVRFKFGSYLSLRLLIAKVNDSKHPTAVIALVPKRSSANFVKWNQLPFVCHAHSFPQAGVDC